MRHFALFFALLCAVVLAFHVEAAKAQGVITLTKCDVVTKKVPDARTAVGNSWKPWKKPDYTQDDVDAKVAALTLAVTNAETAVATATAAKDKNKVAKLQTKLQDAVTAAGNAVTTAQNALNAFNALVAQTTLAGTVAFLKASTNAWTIHGLWPHLKAATQLPPSKALINIDAANLLTKWPSCPGMKPMAELHAHEWDSHAAAHYPGLWGGPRYLKDALDLYDEAAAQCKAAVDADMSEVKNAKNAVLVEITQAGECKVSLTLSTTANTHTWSLKK